MRSVGQSGHGLGRTVAVGRPVGPRSWSRGRSRSACRTTVWVARSRSVGQSGRRLQWPKARIPATGRGPTCSKRGGGHEPAGTGRSLKWNDDRRKQFRKLVRFGGERCFKILSRPPALVMAGDPARLERPQPARPGPPRARGGPASHSVRPSARAVSWGGRPCRETHVGVRGSCSRPGLDGGVVTLSSQGGRDSASARSRSPRARVHAAGIPTQNASGQSPRTHTQPYTYTHPFLPVTWYPGRARAPAAGQVARKFE